MKYNDESFEIIVVDDLKNNVEAIRDAFADTPLKKKASAVFKSLNDSDDRLNQTAISLSRVLHNLSNCNLEGVEDRNGFYRTIISFLDGVVIDESVKDDGRNKLVDFSRRVEALRDSSAESDYELELAENVAEIEASQHEELLSRIDTLVKNRNQLIFEYGEVLALIRRLQSSKTEFDKQAKLNEELRLINFIKAYNERIKEEERARQEAERLEEEARLEQERKLAEDAERQRIREEALRRIEEQIREETKRTEYHSEKTELSNENIEVPDSSANLVNEPGTVISSDSIERPVTEQNIESANQGSLDGNRADVVFVIDASGSMRPCFDQLKSHIKRFVAPFKAAGFTSLRLGLLAYSANKDRTADRIVYRNMFLCPDSKGNVPLLYANPDEASRKFFTNGADIEAGITAFVNRLDQIKCRGDEDSAFALDCATDFPFEPMNSTRRAVVLFTDEPMDDGVSKMESMGEGYKTLEKIMEKVVSRHISLYVFGPDSDATEVMSDYSKVFLQTIPAEKDRQSGIDIWDNIGFDKILENIGKNISSNVLSMSEESAYSKATYGQDGWSEESWY